MVSFRSRPDPQETVSRRLELLTAELAASAAARSGAASSDPEWLAGHTRIRGLRPAAPEPGFDAAPPIEPERGSEVESESEVASEVASEPPAVPVPGRHAARRTRGRSRRPPAAPTVSAVRGHLHLGPSQLLVVALLVAAGLAVTGWWVVRGDPERLEAPTPVPVGGSLAPEPALASSPGPGAGQDSAPASAGGSDPAGVEGVSGGSGVGSGSGGAATPASGPGTVTVDVAGKVRRPGIVVLETGARVVDAIEAAGGARPGVDLTPLNLARLLVDGEQVVVGVKAPAVPPPGGGAAPGGTAPGGTVLVNLNTATASELDTLPEVGPVTAEAILAWRSEHGGFTAVEELLEVDGIGDATLARIAPHVTV